MVLALARDVEAYTSQFRTPLTLMIGPLEAMLEETSPSARRDLLMFCFYLKGDAVVAETAAAAAVAAGSVSGVPKFVRRAANKVTHHLLLSGV